MDEKKPIKLVVTEPKPQEPVAFVPDEETTDKQCEDAIIGAYNECLENGVDFEEVLNTLRFIAKGRDNALKKAISSFASVGER